MSARTPSVTASSDPPAEHVVLLDEAGRAIGTAAKAAVHHRRTPLHLAFSCYVFDGAGNLLVTRRALHKKTFPGVWTNTACGHPAAGEPLAEAVHRRVGQEIGLGLADVRLVLPRFRYTATMDTGVTENEMCPVFTAATSDQPDADPDEVATVVWEPWDAFSADVLGGRREVSVWCAAQVAALVELGPDPDGWPTGDPALLPPAARTP